MFAMNILFIHNSMIICVDPGCLVPENPESSTSCRYCGSQLLLFDRYLPIQMIGEGGFGRTFLVIDQKGLQSEQYLIKQFYLNQSNQSSTLIRKPNVTVPGIPGKINLEEFRLKEISALKKLKHPQVPRYIDDFYQDKYFYVVQEFIEGKTLSNELSRYGKFSEIQVVGVLKSVLNVLKYVHSQNIIHRDIKPENLIRGLDKNIVLVDFGAVKFVADNSQKNINHTVKAATTIGTPNYMAPEQNKAKEIYASDLYSLGVTCIQLLTGKSPNELFDDGNNSWDWKSKSTPITPGLISIIDKLLEFGTTKRYQSAQDVVDDLENINNLKNNVKKRSGKNKNHFNIQGWLNSLGTFGQGIGGIMGILLAFGVFKSCSNNQSQANTNIASIDSLSAILKSGDWKRADSETYDLLLQIAGKAAKSRGFILPTELKNMSCTDLGKIDKSWRDNTNGKQGLSAQQLVYERAGHNWKKAYQQMNWGVIKNGDLIKTVDRDLDWKNRRFQYKLGKEPNFTIPKPGHLPVIMNLVQGIAFPQFTKVCK
jgi:serine/threonine protein kinase